ncbi:MAG TPA: hypothetical protein PLG67_04770 [Bacillota bacterium]|jgi:hypothetical protein|nr:hypothetical protein [Bacillota bacterium]HQL35890.1 hypothetical protein [Bacillota bacterium]
MLLKIIQIYVPEPIRKRKLNELFRLTADAFQCGPPELRGLSFADCLSKYALFTREQAESYLAGGAPIEEIKHRLYQNSFIYGQDLRKSFHISEWEESVKALGIIYRLIGIDFHYEGQGEFIIKQCFFSRYYTKEACMLISSLDEGMAAGLSGGGRLCFNGRITEGFGCCKGFLRQGD